MPVTKPVTAKLEVHFASLTDPRRRKVRHPLINFIVIAMCAVICGADDFVAIADFGRMKRRWFRGILDLRGGIPSHDTGRPEIANDPMGAHQTDVLGCSRRRTVAARRSTSRP